MNSKGKKNKVKFTPDGNILRHSGLTIAVCTDAKMAEMLANILNYQGNSLQTTQELQSLHKQINKNEEMD